MGEEHGLEKASALLEEKLSSLREPSAWSKVSIFSLPARVTAANETAYRPHILSIGPYHHGEPSFEAMEGHKYRAVCQFLKRTNKGVRDLFKVLAPVAQDLKDAYDQLDDPKWEDTDAFLRVMVVDGCFILEVLRTRTDDSSQTHGYPSSDPVFDRHGSHNVSPYIDCDVLILDNQIPLLALQKLHSMQNEVIEIYAPAALIYRFLAHGISLAAIEKMHGQGQRNPPPPVPTNKKLPHICINTCPSCI